MDGVSVAVSGSKGPLVRVRLRMLRAGPTAQIVSSRPLISILWLSGPSIPSNGLKVGTWLKKSSGRASFALDFVPSARIAFLWFIGALRDYLAR
jgi:hypothetical protein